ncbi:hypothetical protein ARMGADRAFT_1092176 [Armillaria gallica]|uniref:C2H2-type domain-containing protein n=1 Tax=Armillaria gallica TaxID=47427 RepID=A0A2H3CMQ7_ARMGA|nr:hypothetical protein ARMGADRAFT_1092176 [Armillaria gallica]
MPRVPSEKSKNRARVVCQICGKDYADGTGLSRHKKVHNPFATMYQCTYCPKAMNQKSNLDSHINNTHLAPHKCPVAGCSKAFTKPRGLERHLRKCNGPQDLYANMSSSSVLPPSQLLPAVGAGMPLEGFAAFPTSPQSDLHTWSPKELISDPDSFPNSYIPNKLPGSPTFYEHQGDRQTTVSNVERLDLKEMEQWLRMYSNTSNLGATNALPFDSSFPGPSTSTSSNYSVSPASTSFVEDDQLSPLTLEQMLAPYLPLDDALSMYSCPPTLRAVDMTINTSFPSPIDRSSTVNFSFLSFETTDSSFSFDSGLSLPSSSSFEQSLHTTDSFSLF